MPDKHLRNAVILFSCLFVAGVMVLISMFTGCAARVKHVTNLPAGVTEQQAKDWDTAVANLHKMADITTALRKAVIAARNAGAFPDDTAYANTLRELANVDVLELNAKHLLAQTPNNFSASEKGFVRAQMNALLGELQTINSEGITGIKNQGTLGTVNGLISELQATANLVLGLSL